jgi:hypothetical protein
MRASFDFGLELEDTEHGLLVRQYDQAYVARNWQLTPPVVELVETCLGVGLTWAIRKDHPRSNSRWPNPRGVVYLAFSPTPDFQWALAIDTWKPNRGDFDFGAFNGKYQTQFLQHDIPFRFEKRNKGAGHMEVDREHVLSTIRKLGGFDHSVLQMFRPQPDAEGYGTEYDIQRDLLINWTETVFAQEGYRVVQDEFPVDGGLTSRRIDILTRQASTQDWLIIELKRAEASHAAVLQVADYLRALGRKDQFSFGRLEGCLIAERIPETVAAACRAEGIRAYEIAWPLTLVRKA